MSLLNKLITNFDKTNNSFIIQEMGTGIPNLLHVSFNVHFSNHVGIDYVTAYNDVILQPMNLHEPTKLFLMLSLSLGVTFSSHKGNWGTLQTRSIIKRKLVFSNAGLYVATEISYTSLGICCSMSLQFTRVRTSVVKIQPA